MGFSKFGKMKSVTYKLVRNNKAVYIGTTNNPHLRGQQHAQAGKKFDRMVITSPGLPRQEAERREARNIKSYRAATGRNPGYNKTPDGKFKKR
jgi:predicted GIY-YIG superfamily endonuclease